jgi:hypothetical protein
MPYVHDLSCRVEGKRVSARYHTAWQSARPAMLDIPLYRQLDYHSCSFLAVLAVIRYFAPQTPVMEVLRAAAPSSSSGLGWQHLVRCLKRFGIVAEWRERLGLQTLRRLTADRKPVIVTVEPEGYVCDHWTVIRGVDLRTRRVHLTYYEYTDAEGSMEWAKFQLDCSPRGCGWVCEQ